MDIKTNVSVGWKTNSVGLNNFNVTPVAANQTLTSPIASQYTIEDQSRDPKNPSGISDIPNHGKLSASMQFQLGSAFLGVSVESPESSMKESKEVQYSNHWHQGPPDKWGNFSRLMEIGGHYVKKTLDVSPMVSIDAGISGTISGNVEGRLFARAGFGLASVTTKDVSKQGFLETEGGVSGNSDYGVSSCYSTVWNSENTIETTTTPSTPVVPLSLGVQIDRHLSESISISGSVDAGYVFSNSSEISKLHLSAGIGLGYTF